MGARAKVRSLFNVGRAWSLTTICTQSRDLPDDSQRTRQCRCKKCAIARRQKKPTRSPLPWVASVIARRLRTGSSELHSYPVRVKPQMFRLTARRITVNVEFRYAAILLAPSPFVCCYKGPMQGRCYRPKRREARISRQICAMGGRGGFGRSTAWK